MNTAAVIHMNGMFYNARAFNQPIGSWNTGAVRDMYAMFRNATAFNQPVGAWNIANVGGMENMFTGAALCTENYDNLLNGWAPQRVKTYIIFHGGDSEHSSTSSKARATLISKGWTIYDGGMGKTMKDKCIITKMENTFHASETTFYPNPVKDKLSILYAKPPSNEKFNYAVFSTSGLFLLEIEAISNGRETEIELNYLPQGLYFLKIRWRQNTAIYSFVKE